MNEAKLMEFVGKAVGDVGAVLAGSLVVLGDRLGFYRALAQAGPMTSEELAVATGTRERLVREWLAEQAATGYLDHLGEGRFELPEEHAVALTHETSPAFVTGAFEIALGSVQATDRIADAMRHGGGLAWSDQDAHVHSGCERFFKPGYVNFLTSTWIPALDGVQERLEQGTSVADIGCGHGASTVHMAGAYPRSRFLGIDPHEGSLEVARKAAADAGVADRARFERATAKELGGSHGLIAFFDCLHDLGDPVGALRAAREHLEDDGTVLLVEPNAGDTTESNLNPVGAAYYGFSTLLCTPNALAQEGERVLGTQAGQARLTEVANEAGFGRVRRVAETPFNMVLELRP
jgi:2-polyprenyl-3-methyl-5-hydroxy-6-metoxy-1,4-benzoquinol methylase